VLEKAQPFIFIALALIALVQWRRYPGRASAWLCAAFVVMGIVVGLSAVLPQDSADAGAVWAGKGMLAILVLFPYCLFRFMATFVRPIAWIKTAATMLTFSLVVAAFFLPNLPEEGESLPAWLEAYVLVLLLQWVSLSGLVAARLWRAGSGQPLVARRRMQLMSIGAVGLALALVVAGEFSNDEGGGLIVQLLALAGPPLILVGFTPPHFLKSWWQRADEEAFREAEQTMMEATTTPEVVSALLPSARKLVGAGGASLRSADGAVLGREGTVPEDGEQLDPPGPVERSSVIRVPMRGYRLTLFASPFTPFFGREELVKLEELAALGALALGRNDLLDDRQRLASIVESSDDAILSKTLDGKIVTWNRGAERIYGYKAVEIVGEPVSRLIPPGHVNDVPRLLARVRSNESIQHYETKRLTKDGRIIDVAITISPLKDSDGTITGASTIARDITETKRLQEELQVAKGVAEQANLAKNEFLSRMSHELRTPLNAILGFGQLLEREDLSADHKDSVRQIIKGGRRLLELINEVLDISRIESGSLEFSLEPVSVASVIQDAVDLINPLAVERGIRLSVDLPQDLQGSHVSADQQRLGQVLLNLLSNALKYNVDNGAVWVIAAQRDDEVRISVADTGLGIPEEKLPLLFTPFERLGAEQSKVEGTGLGLTLSKRLVEAMGGRLEVETKGSSEGTTFSISLRTASGLSVDTAGPTLRAVGPPDARAGSVLYIEDNLSNLRLIERLVAYIGDLEVISAMTGALGLDLAQQHRPHLILLDLHLPDIQGDEVLLKLRRDPRTTKIPIVVLSADATPGQIERLLLAGADEYLTKPLDVAEFIGMIDRILGRPEVNEA
jgi:PAS domain S-box-containing protein